MILVKIASIPNRVRQLEKTVHTLINHADKIDVYLNNYSTIPDFLRQPKIQVFSSRTHGDRGDIGKFFQIEDASGYVLTVDDDLIYPDNYVPEMIKKIDYYNKKYFVCVHANDLPKHILSSYYKEKIGVHFQAALEEDRQVDIPGTGTLGFHTDEIKLSEDIFIKRNMSDIWLAIYAKKNNIPIISIKRTAGWLVQARGEEFNQSIYNLSFDNDSYHTRVVNQSFYFKTLGASTHEAEQVPFSQLNYQTAEPYIT